MCFAVAKGDTHSFFRLENNTGGDTPARFVGTSRAVLNFFGASGGNCRSRVDTGRISWFTRTARISSSLKRGDMSRVLLGVICGLVFGAIDIGIMLPMSFPDKKAAITAAFIARFGIGFVIGAARLPWPGWGVGLCFGLLLSIPDAIITKTYGPIIAMGAIGGTIIGVIVGRFGR